MPPSPRVLRERLAEGEALCSNLGDEADDALVVACTAGAIVVGYPIAYLVGRTLTFLDPPRLLPGAALPGPRTVAFQRWAASIPPCRDRRVPRSKAVVLVDDGLLSPVPLVAMACALRNARPRRLVVAAPWLRPEARASLHGVADRVHPARRSPEPTWYPEPASLARAAGLLSDVVGRCRRSGEITKYGLEGKAG
ncbi:MAG: hypothetical protein ACOZNI_08615 [Myxococcota bacterium]